MIIFFLFLACLFVLGSVPFGYLLSRAFANVDIRGLGSGNIGATNVMRLGGLRGKVLSALTFFLDFAKVFLPLMFIKKIEYSYGMALAGIGNMVLDLNITGLSAQLLNSFGFLSLVLVSGHCFSVFLKFRGGKGVASFLGFLFSFSLYLGGCALVCWFVSFIFSRVSAVASLIMVLIFNMLLIGGGYFGNLSNIFIFIMGIVIFYKHRRNILDLLNKYHPPKKSHS